LGREANNVYSDLKGGVFCQEKNERYASPNLERVEMGYITREKNMRHISRKGLELRWLREKKGKSITRKGPTEQKSKTVLCCSRRGLSGRTMKIRVTKPGISIKYLVRWEPPAMKTERLVAVGKQDRRPADQQGVPTKILARGVVRHQFT